MNLARNFVWIPLCLLLSACVNQSIKSTSVPPIQTPATNVSEAQLLDVAVVVFDPGLEDYDEDEQVYPEVRKAEARFMPMQLSEAMQDSGAWGAVRVVPNDSQITDLIVRGEILLEGKNLIHFRRQKPINAVSVFYFGNDSPAALVSNLC